MGLGLSARGPVQSERRSLCSAVDADADDGRHEAAIQSRHAVSRERLLAGLTPSFSQVTWSQRHRSLDVNQAIELPLASLGCVLGIDRQPRPRIIQAVHKDALNVGLESAAGNDPPPPHALPEAPAAAPLATFPSKYRAYPSLRFEPNSVLK